MSDQSIQLLVDHAVPIITALCSLVGAITALLVAIRQTKTHAMLNGYIKQHEEPARDLSKSDKPSPPPSVLKK